MKTDRWQRVETLFAEAIALPTHERATFLDEATDDDATLRAEIEALLDADDGAGTFAHQLEDQVVRPVIERVLEDRDPLVGAQVGPYRVEARVGAGGMGMVYRAVRADGAFEQTVALKVVRVDLQPEMHARFLAERQILARLDHPSIARLHDGGVTPDGRPWLAMELVDGLPVTDYADVHRLTINERLELFRQICTAVAYAHHNLVVHRDLKPSNILVTPHGEVKLLDFGIARLIDGHQEGLTVDGSGPMTPRYAAPEQIRGSAITVATDVYSLGVILFELLTGRPPYRVSGNGRHEMERAILEEEPTNPSTVVERVLPDTAEETTATHHSLSQARGLDPLTLRRRLAGDLDVIVLKALRKEPDQRYPTATALEQDVDRHLQGRPLLARPATFSYRAHKFVRRHRSGVLAAAVVLFSLIGGLGVALWQAGQAAAAAEQARADAELAESVTDFLVGLFEASDPTQARGDSLIVRDILDRGRTQIAADLAAQPAVRGRFESVMGTVYINLGMLETADSLLSSALSIQRETLGAESLPVALTLRSLSSVHAHRGEIEAALSAREQSLAMLQRHLPGDDARVASAMVSLGHSLTTVGDYEQAEEVLRDGYLMHQRLAAGEPTRDLATAANNLAILHYHQRDHEAATERFQESLELLQLVLGEAPNPHVAITLDNLSTLLMAQERYEEAEPFVRQAVEMQRELFRDALHPNLAISLNNLGVLLEHTGRPRGAEEVQREVLAIREEIYGRNHTTTGNTLSQLGGLARNRGDYEEAEHLFIEAIQSAEEGYPPGHRDWGLRVRRLAGMLYELGRTEEAEQLYVLSYERAAEHYGTDHEFALEALQLLSDFYDASGRPEEAERFRTTAY